VHSNPDIVEDANNDLQVLSPFVNDHFIGVGAEAQLEPESQIRDEDSKRPYINPRLVRSNQS
jgi:hypothetical protein